MQPRISLVTLGVRNLVKSIKFYEEGLGFPRLESGPGMAFFTLNGTWLGLYPREALAEDATVPAEGNGFESFTLAHNVRSEAEVDDVIDHAVSKGATLVKKPQRVSWGGYGGYFKDPDGHRGKSPTTDSSGSDRTAQNKRQSLPIDSRHPCTPATLEGSAMR